MISPPLSSEDNIGPLEGVKVLDLTRHPPGDFCTMLLADYGAEVLKVEDLDGGDTTRWSLPKASREGESWASSMAVGQKASKPRRTWRTVRRF